MSAFNFGRRAFMQRGCKAIVASGLAAGAPPVAAGVTQLLTDDAAVNTPYRALICINLQGGNDGFNMLVPTATAEYNEYQQGRGHLAVAAGDLAPLNTMSSHSTTVGLHSQMAPLVELFDRGELACLANVGTLLQPTTAQQARERSVPLPEQLFSHHDQARQWQKLDHQKTGHSGWAARAADILAPRQSYPGLTAVSLDGSNNWQGGSDHPVYNIGRQGVASYSGMDKLESPWQHARRTAFIQLLHQRYEHVFERSYAELQLRAMVLSANVGAALEKLGELQTPLPNENRLAEQLQMVVKLIAIKDEFRMNRQFFYVNLGGFDTHDDQLAKQPWLFSQLADALSYTRSALAEIGMLDCVTTFTSSDFGRTVTSNGDGTDHGWGNHHLIMGGAVKGADIYGAMPRIAVDGPDDWRNGRIVPSTSAAQYAGTLLSWMGLPQSDLHNLLPTLGNFDQADLGFML